MKKFGMILAAASLSVAALSMAGCGDRVPIGNGSGTVQPYNPLSIEDAYRDLDQARAKADQVLASDPTFAGSLAAHDVATYLEDAKTYLAAASVDQDKADKTEYQQALAQAHSCITAATDLLASRGTHSLSGAR